MPLPYNMDYQMPGGMNVAKKEKEVKETPVEETVEEVVEETVETPEVNP